MVSEFETHMLAEGQFDFLRITSEPSCLPETESGKLKSQYIMCTKKKQTKNKTPKNPKETTVKELLLFLPSGR